ncbi:MAG: DUF58 domain-containing protein [Alphaproteobacteria bacterium]|nr:DUF58 domain-containing protein [Alphaproteobacteria bacterium]MBU0858923.1 DUF58 domain-containing protein [Alphaproteobacteria bacterium]
MATTQDAKKKPIWFSWLHGADEAAAGLPAILSAADKAATSILTGDHSQRKPGIGEKFWQFREYSEGDRPQDIDWRRSARGDRLYVRQKEWQTTQTVLFWCQRNRAMTYHSRPHLARKGDHAMILTLALASLFNGGGEQTGMLTGEIRPGRTESTRLRIANHIYDTRTADLPRTDALQIPMNGNIVLAGDFLAPPALIADCFDRIAARAASAIVIQVLDPAEIELPFSGRMIFENELSGLKQHIENVESVREEFRARMRAQMAAVAEICRRHGWGWYLHMTDRAPKSTLHDIWVSTGGAS